MVNFSNAVLARDFGRKGLSSSRLAAPDLYSSVLWFSPQYTQVVETFWRRAQTSVARIGGCPETAIEILAGYCQDLSPDAKVQHSLCHQRDGIWTFDRYERDARCGVWEAFH